MLISIQSHFNHHVANSSPHTLFIVAVILYFNRFKALCSNFQAFSRSKASAVRFDALTSVVQLKLHSYA